ncbi:hypothetical protein ACGFYU_22095 [Streptomyces sp. NPDC048337]|uniref:hypothetical protein n=1 Tax=Streptomyces sp. NPDC048337 TaxID=3365535 RepID=UPI00371D64E7
MSRSRKAAEGRAAALRLAALPLLPAAILPLTGCGALGGASGSASGAPRAADQGRPAARAQGPYRPWPERPPAPPAVDDVLHAEGPLPIDGMELAEGTSLRDVRPMDVLAADLRSRPGAPYPSAPDAPAAPDEAGEEEMKAALARCADPGAGDCPVRKAHYRDLTGNGRDELILGIELPGHRLNLRVYTADSGRVVQIMDTAARVTDVQLTERDLIIQSATSPAGTELRTAWTWLPERQIMMPRVTETVRRPAAEKP